MITGKPLFTVEQIQSRVRELAGEISRDFRGKAPLVVCVLRGAFMFFSDIVRHIQVPMTVDFIVASSYEKTDTTGEIKLHCDIREDVQGKDVLLIEDIVDTGITLSRIRQLILDRNPSSLKICAFLDKKERRLTDVPVDYVGYDIPNVYVVGYGLDYENHYRNLPYIAVFKQDEKARNV